MQTSNYFRKALYEAEFKLRKDPIGTVIDIGSVTYPLVFKKTEEGVLAVGDMPKILQAVKAKRLRAEQEAGESGEEPDWRKQPYVPPPQYHQRALTWGEAMYKRLTPWLNIPRTTDRAVSREVNKFDGSK